MDSEIKKKYTYGEVVFRKPTDAIVWIPLALLAITVCLGLTVNLDGKIIHYVVFTISPIFALISLPLLPDFAKRWREQNLTFSDRASYPSGRYMYSSFLFKFQLICIFCNLLLVLFLGLEYGPRLVSFITT